LGIFTTDITVLAPTSKPTPLPQSVLVVSSVEVVQSVSTRGISFNNSDAKASSIEELQQEQSSQALVSAIVKVTDGSGKPANGAQVFIRWSGAMKGTDEKITDLKGKVRFSRKALASGDASFTISKIKRKDDRFSSKLGAVLTHRFSVNADN
jgi:hypothetical protein